MSFLSLLVCAGIIFAALVACTFIKDKKKSYFAAFGGVFALVLLLIIFCWANYPVIFYNDAERQLAFMNSDNGYVIAKNIENPASAKIVVVSNGWTKGSNNTAVEGVVYGLRFGGVWNHNIARYGYGNFLGFRESAKDIKGDNLKKLIGDLKALEPDYVLLDSAFSQEFYEQCKANGIKVVLILSHTDSIPAKDIEDGWVEFSVQRALAAGLPSTPPFNWDAHTKDSVFLTKKK